MKQSAYEWRLKAYTSIMTAATTYTYRHLDHHVQKIRGGVHTRTPTRLHCVDLTAIANCPALTWAISDGMYPQALAWL